MSSLRIPLAVMLLGVMGCSTVRPVSHPAQFIPQTNPDVVVVIYKNHSQVPVADPRVSGDTLLGTWMGVGEPVAVPLSRVERIEARQRDKKRTTLLIAGVAVLAAAGSYALAQAVRSENPSCDFAYTGPGHENGDCISVD